MWLNLAKVSQSCIMIVLPVWGLGYNMFHPDTGWLVRKDYLLLTIGLVVLCVQMWIVIEGLLVWRSARGMLEEKLPPLPKSTLAQATADGGRSC